MTTDLVERVETLSAIEAEPQRGSMLAIIARAASDPNVDVEKMRALLVMQTQIEDRQAARDYVEALNNAQAEIAPIARTAENAQTRSFYAKLEDVVAVLRPIYIRHGFSLSFTTAAPLTPGNIRIECLCAHRGGHVERYGREAAADTLGPKGSAIKTALHGGASTETFLKRYIICGIFNIVFRDQDDDGVFGGLEFIDADKVAKIENLLRVTNSDRIRFFAFVRGDSNMTVEKVEDIRVVDFPRAIAQLERKQREQEAGKR